MTHNSEEEGTGLADVLFGDYNPAGRLTQTWVASMADLPEMMDYNIRDGRTYMYAKQKPLYAFGYGLSYTTFAYSDLKLSSGEIKSGGDLSISVEVKNNGSRPGDEVVQLYITHLGSKVARAAEELEGFDRVSLAPDETKTVTLPLKAQQLAYWSDETNGWLLEPDRVEIRVGSSSDNIRLRKTVTVAP
jgi:beta-glucosidase